MKLLWTKSHLPLSVVIRDLTGEPCSHFSFLFESEPEGVIFQSNLLGTGIEFFTKAQQSWGYEIVHEKDLPMTDAEEDRAWDIIVKKYSLVKYNFGGASYLGYRKALHRLIKTPIPKINKWSQPGTMFCDQIYQILNEINDPRIPKIDVLNGMDTPEDIWLKVS